MAKTFINKTGGADLIYTDEDKIDEWGIIPNRTSSLTGAPKTCFRAITLVMCFAVKPHKYAMWVHGALVTKGKR